MNIKIILYLIILPISMWSISALRIEGAFKKNSENQIKIMYIFLSISMTYLIVQFFSEFYQITSTIK